MRRGSRQREDPQGQAFLPVSSKTLQAFCPLMHPLRFLQSTLPTFGNRDSPSFPAPPLAGPPDGHERLLSAILEGGLVTHTWPVPVPHVTCEKRDNCCLLCLWM